MKRIASRLSIRSIPEVSVMTPVADRSHQVFLLYVGGGDDKVAVRFILQSLSSRVVFDSLSTTQPAKDAVSRAQLKLGKESQKCRRSRGGRQRHSCVHRTATFLTYRRWQCCHTGAKKVSRRHGRVDAGCKGQCQLTCYQSC